MITTVLYLSGLLCLLGSIPACALGLSADNPGPGLIAWCGGMLQLGLARLLELLEGRRPPRPGKGPPPLRGFPVQEGREASPHA